MGETGYNDWGWVPPLVGLAVGVGLAVTAVTAGAAIVQQRPIKASINQYGVSLEIGSPAKTDIQR